MGHPKVQSRIMLSASCMSPRLVLFSTDRWLAYPIA